METNPTRFEVGRTYAQRFACDYDSIVYFTIRGRTGRTITTEVQGKTVRRGVRVSRHDNVEHFKPYGSYSMAMVVSATDTAEKIASGAQ